MAPPTTTATRPKAAATDLAASNLIAFVRERGRRPKAHGQHGQTVPDGPRALKRMPTQALVAETIRRIGNQGKLTANDRRHLGAEFDRRGLDHAARAVRDDQPKPPPAESRLNDAAAKAMVIPCYDTSAGAGAKADVEEARGMIGQVIRESRETKIVDEQVVKEPLSNREQDADLADVGLPASVIGAVAFVATHRKDELPELMSQQAEMARADNAPTSDLSAEAEMEDAQNMSM